MTASRSSLFIGALAMMMAPGCCCRKGCIDLNSQTIKLQGFTLEEADSVIVITRLIADEELADTSLSSGREGLYFSPPDLSLFIPDLENPHLEREIIFTQIGRTYRLDGIERELKVCNACFIPGGTDHYHVLARHQVDGEHRTGVITLVR